MMKHTTQHSEQFKRQRRFMMALPLLTLPFLMFAFWALGGGTPSPDNVASSGGLNVTLPSPDLDQEPAGKLEVYQQAEKEALEELEQLRLDPYAEFLGLERLANRGSARDPLPIDRLDVSSDLEKKEREVQQKLNALQLAVGHDSQSKPPTAVTSNEPKMDISMEEDLQHLERMMHTMARPAMEDPEMKQIEGMLNKILDVQHPERVRERLEKSGRERRGETFAVRSTPGKISPDPEERENSRDIQSGYSIPVPTESNAFYGLEDHNSAGITEMRPAIPAVIHEDQTLVSGATVKMQLMQSVFINGLQIPKGALVFGTCAVNGERLDIQVESIRKDNLILPVNLMAYGMDALPGIRVPGAISRKMAKDEAGNAVQSMRLMPSMHPSLEMQAAGAGIEAAKGLFSKKSKLIKVTVKAGHPLLLLDKSSQNQ